MWHRDDSHAGRVLADERTAGHSPLPDRLAPSALPVPGSVTTAPNGRHRRHRQHRQHRQQEREWQRILSRRRGRGRNTCKHPRNRLKEDAGRPCWNEAGLDWLPGEGVQVRASANRPPGGSARPLRCGAGGRGSWRENGDEGRELTQGNGKPEGSKPTESEWIWNEACGQAGPGMAERENGAVRPFQWPGSGRRTGRRKQVERC